jgi:serine/threonine protein kinase
LKATDNPPGNAPESADTVAYPPRPLPGADRTLSPNGYISRAGEDDSTKTRVLESELTGNTTLLLETDTEPATADGSSSAEPAEGLTLKGRYRLEERIGSGGTGIVFRATDLEAVRLGRSRPEVAVKVLRADLRNREAALFDEVEKTRQMQQENIVDVYGFEPDQAGSFMVMELLNGAPLDRFVKSSWPRGMPLSLAAPYIRAMGAALAYAHKRGLVHSDFKPSNVLVTGESVKVLDFGIARAARAGEAASHPSEELLGLTPQFASCEMLELRPADRRDDVFCFGLVVYFLLSGRHPFDGLDAIEARSRGLAVAPIRGLTPLQNAALRAALRFERGERSSSIEGLLRELEPGGRHRALKWGALGAAALSASALGWVYYVESVAGRDSDQQLLVKLCKSAASMQPAMGAADPHVVATLLEQGNRYLAMGQKPFDPGVLSENVSSALGAFQSVLALSPERCDDAAQGILKIAKVYKNEANRLYERGEYTQAAQMALVALRIWTDNEEMQSLLQKIRKRLPPDPDS